MIKTIIDTAVRAKREVTLPIDKKQAEELKNALSIVEKYKKEAFKFVDVVDSDWVMINYKVSNDKVIVTVEDGACG